MAEQQIFEYRGVDKFYFAEVTKDDETGYACGTPVHIPVQEVGKTTDSSSEAHYYDNKAMIVVNSESADTISLVLAPPALAQLAEMTGKSFDTATGMMVDSPRQNKYFAIMYRTKGTDGHYRYVSRLKGQFNIPDETNATENDGTDTNNVTFEFTGIYTEHEFTKGKKVDGAWETSGVKGIIVDDRYEAADVSTFFSEVQTPDTIEGANVPATGVTLNKSTAAVVVGNDTQLVATVAPATATNKNVTWTTSDGEKATVSNAGLVTGVGAGEATITATTVDGSFTATCTVTVVSAG